jgi:hypothetical protein
MCCMSETSPPKPMTVVSANVRRRLTSVNRAREPYDAIKIECQLSLDMVCSSELVAYGLKECSPRLSAARTTPSLNLTPNTDVPVTAGDCVCVFGNDC